MGGRLVPRPPGGVPGHKVITSFGSVGRTPSPTTTVSASANFGKAAAARPNPITARRSMGNSVFDSGWAGRSPALLLFWMGGSSPPMERIAPFFFFGQGVLCRDDAPLSVVRLVVVRPAGPGR